MAKKKNKAKANLKKTSKKKLEEEVLETIELNQNDEGSDDLQDLDSMVELEEGEMLVSIEASEDDQAIDPEEELQDHQLDYDEYESEDEDLQASPDEQTEMSPVDLEPDDEGLEDDDLDEECTFDLAQRKRVIEAVLFISDKSVGVSTLKSAFGVESEESEKIIVNNKHIKEGVEALEQDYIENNRGYRLFTVDGGYQIRTADDLKPFLQNTIKARSFRLTGPSLETLAMIAYKQPCTKSQIDDIRGVDSSHLVRALMDRGMVSFAGKSELPGKPMLYKTTSKFLDIFGLRNLKELPSLAEIEALLPEGIGDEEEDEKETLSDLTGKLSEQFEGEYSASEEELGKISDQLSTISTETDFFEKEKQRQKDKRDQEKAESLKEALMVGEEVSTRDKNWLERYEAALLAKVTEEELAVTENEEEGSSEKEVGAGVIASGPSDEEDAAVEDIEVDILVQAPASEDSISDELVEIEMVAAADDDRDLEENEEMLADSNDEVLASEDENNMEDEENTDLPPLNENV